MKTSGLFTQQRHLKHTQINTIACVPREKEKKIIENSEKFSFLACQRHSAGSTLTLHLTLWMGFDNWKQRQGDILAKCTSYIKLSNKRVRIPRLCSNASSGKTANGRMHSETADGSPQLAL